MTRKPVKIGTFTKNIRIRDDETKTELQLTPEQLRTELRRLTRSGNPAVRAQAGKALTVVEAAGARR